MAAKRTGSERPPARRSTPALPAVEGPSPQPLAQAAGHLAVEREEAVECDEDEGRYQLYLRAGEAVEHDEVTAWLDSIGTENPLPPPHGNPLAQTALASMGKTKDR